MFLNVCAMVEKLIAHKQTLAEVDSAPRVTQAIACATGLCHGVRQKSNVEGVGVYALRMLPEWWLATVRQANF